MGDWKEEDYLPLSALQHYMFCPRQCALIHMEGVWSENYLTATGRVLHEKVHSGDNEKRGDIIISRSLKLCSNEKGVFGVADLIEFNFSMEKTSSTCYVPGRTGNWIPFPVEYKRGKMKSHRADEVQLCAQALCLEEMLDVVIINGALYYGMDRRRKEVDFDEPLRQLTDEVIQKTRRLLSNKILPKPQYGSQCSACSLVDFCKPQLDQAIREKVFMGIFGSDYEETS